MLIQHLLLISDRHLKLNMFKLNMSLAPTLCPKPTIAIVFPCCNKLQLHTSSHSDQKSWWHLWFLSFFHIPYPIYLQILLGLLIKFPGQLPSISIAIILTLAIKIFHLDYRNSPSLVWPLLFYLSTAYSPHCNEKDPLKTEVKFQLCIQNSNILSYPE